MAKGKGIFAAIGAGTALSAVAGAYKFGEFTTKVKKLHEVGPENAVFVRLISRVHQDLNETRRLVALPEVEYALSTAPEKVAWINSVMKSTRGALERMGPFTERVAEDTADGGHVGIRHRLRWVLDEKERLVNHNLELVACHNSLTQVLGFLAAMEPLACCQEDKPKQQQQQRIGQTTTREVDIEFEKRRGPVKDLRFEREVRREVQPREGRREPQEWQYKAEVRREGGPREFEYEAEVRREGPPRGEFQYQAEVRREGAPREFQYKAEVRRHGGGHEEWVEEREVRRDQKDYYTPDPRDVPRMSTWPRSRL